LILLSFFAFNDLVEWIFVLVLVLLREGQLLVYKSGEGELMPKKKKPKKTKGGY